MDGTAYSTPEYKKAFAKAKMKGLDDEAAEEAAKKEYLASDPVYLANQAIIANKGFASDKEKERFDKAQEISARQEQIKKANYLNKDGVLGPEGLKQSLANSFRNAGGALGKALVDGILPALKIDPNKIAEISRFASNKKYDEKGNVVGQYWKTKTYDDTYSHDRGKGFGDPKKVFKDAGNAFVGSIKSGATAIKDAVSSIGSASHKDRFYGLVRGIGTGLAGILAPFGNNTKVSPPNATDKQTLEATQETSRMVEQYGKRQEKLLNAILKKLP